MLLKVLRRAAPLIIGLTLFLGTSALAQSPVLDAPAQPLVETVKPVATAATVPAGGESTVAKAYAVDYVNALRNLCAVAVVALVLAHAQGNAGRSRKKGGHTKSYVALIVVAMFGLLATQALAFWLYRQESAIEGGRMHKTVPFGRTYFLY